MINMRFIRHLFYIVFVYSNLFSNNFDKDFIDSFIKHYEFNPQGRYVHEYHASLLDKTAQSLDELENILKQENFSLIGRTVICGYEEQAIPSYYPDFKKSKISDEASSKNKVGWSKRLHNKFGFMTGFLFKDFNYYAQYWYKNENPIFYHVDPEDVEIFDERASIFQQHAFGQSFDLILLAQKDIIKNFSQRKFREIFKDLIKFWNCIYNFKIVTGSKEVAGTQDVLFSVEYANHLIRSNLNLNNFFVGPDITYPIEISNCQTQDATIHAQNFVKIFEKKLVAPDNKPTVYVFCSFVDGVGKSTMLGNIKNYIKYGNNIKNYERVDNSSSQLAEIFKLKDNVFIADLPAQVSHFTYKPDGFVYVNIAREYSQIEIDKISDYVRANIALLKNQYEKDLSEVEKLVENDNYFDKTIFDMNSPEKIFLKNLVLLKKDSANKWIPFKYDNKNYLFNYYNPDFIRVLVPLPFVQSEGLKNIESEQMIFYDGIRLPFPYKTFLNDFIKKLKSKDIEQVVFVDFISMYPRSSRENIRVNYLLQQMSLLDKNFNHQVSLYRDFVNDSELFYLLRSRENFKKIENSLKLETLVRLSLFKIILNRNIGDLSGYSFEQITNLIKKEIDLLDLTDKTYLDDLVKNKINKETEKLEATYGMTKSFINLQLFSFKNVKKFSDYLSKFFAENIENEELNNMWQNPGSILIEKDLDNGILNKKLATDKDFVVYSYYCFDEQCRDEVLLSQFIKNLRANWYAAISNLLFCKKINQDLYSLKEENLNVIPYFLLTGKDKYFLARKSYSDNAEITLKADLNIFKNFNLNSTGSINFLNIGKKNYRVDWNCFSSNVGIFAFDCNMASMNKNYWEKSIVTYLVGKYQKSFDQNNVMPTSFLLDELKESMLWKDWYKRLLIKAKENSVKKEKNLKNNDKKEKEVEKVKIYLGTKDMEDGARLVVKFLATLELVLKDPEADIVVRLGDRQDFKAALILAEKVTLPKYFGIIFEQNLFEDYDSVEPLIPFDQLEV